MNTWIAGKDLMKYQYLIKKAFYSEFDLEDTTDEDYIHSQKVFKEFRLKNVGEYHGLYVHYDTLLLSDVFANFRNKCIEIYELDPAHILTAPGLAWQAYLKNTGVKLELLTDIDVIKTEKRIRGKYVNMQNQIIST